MKYKIPTIKGHVEDVVCGVVVHQVNCRAVMGSGVAKCLREKYPQHYNDYMLAKQELGNIVVTEAEKDTLYIVGAFGQYNYGRDGMQYTDYDALKTCFRKANELATENGMAVFLPKLIGCGLGGGDWDVVLKLIWENIDNPIIVDYAR